MSPEKPPFNLRANQLVTDPAFLRFASATEEPNFFNIVGQSRYERWHSAFWGWLLDPGGSHGLGEFVINRFLVLLFSEGTLASADAQDQAPEVLSRASLDTIRVRPNEWDHTEMSVDAGRLDIYVEGKLSRADASSGDFHILVEMKVESKISRDQSTAYAKWLIAGHPDDINLLVYILPSETLRSTSEATVGDSRWYCLDFQALHDQILLPALDHHALSAKTRPFIVQYVRNLQIPHRGIKMAITSDEKKLARQLYEKYGDVFDGLAEALQAEGIDYELEQPAVQRQGRVPGRLAVEIEGRQLEGNSVPELFRICLQFLVDSGAVAKMALPWGTGTKRYIIARGPNPQHPNGRDFFAPIEYKGYVLESHMERARSIKILADLCEQLELRFVPVET